MPERAGGCSVPSRCRNLQNQRNVHAVACVGPYPQTRTYQNSPGSSNFSAACKGCSELPLLNSKQPAFARFQRNPSARDAPWKWRRMNWEAAAADARIVALDDPGYSTQLKQIYDPPLILYVRGNETVISQPGIALVGTRHPTPCGSGIAERLACDLAARGLVMVSGMARGIYTAGHRGAIAAKGKTVSVWGTGVDVVYPKENT